MNKQIPLKEIVTVSEMARMCRLSRARFYQLVGEGIFPAASKNPTTNRPFYNREQQKQCLLIRRVNKGANGKAVMFYGCRLEIKSFPRKRKHLPISKSRTVRNSQNPLINELRHGLSQLGMTPVVDADIRRALSQAYPDGHRGFESAELLRAVFGELQRRNTEDNHSG